MRLYAFLPMVLVLGCMREVPVTSSPQSTRVVTPAAIESAPAQGYLEAHANLRAPMPLLGGPIEVRVTQAGGDVLASLPSERALDPVVFGRPSSPLAYGGTPVASGVPMGARATRGDAFTHTTTSTSFGDRITVLREGQIEMRLLDATATDAAVTNDQAQLTASWRDPNGNTYEVRCCQQVMAHGSDHPTFGGVVTNHLMHGFTGIGTPLMPTVFTYAAFWGVGEVRKNGTVLEASHPMQAMLTEDVRVDGHRLAFDREVRPNRMHLHLLVEPEMMGTESVPVRTGYTLPNGQAMPFWHVTFDNVQIEAQRTGPI